MKNLTYKNFESVISEAASLALSDHNAKYDADSSKAIPGWATFIQKRNNLTEAELNQLLLFRIKMEKKTKSKFKVKFTNNLFADLQGEFDKRKTPRLVQIKHGIVDCLIGNLVIGLYYE